MKQNGRQDRKVSRHLRKGIIKNKVKEQDSGNYTCKYITLAGWWLNCQPRSQFPDSKSVRTLERDWAFYDQWCMLKDRLHVHMCKVSVSNQLVKVLKRWGKLKG